MCNVYNYTDNKSGTIQEFERSKHKNKVRGINYWLYFLHHSDWMTEDCNRLRMTRVQKRNYVNQVEEVFSIFK